MEGSQKKTKMPPSPSMATPNPNSTKKMMHPRRSNNTDSLEQGISSKSWKKQGISCTEYRQKKDKVEPRPSKKMPRVNSPSSAFTWAPLKKSSS